jgi:hypothetical protein
MALSLVYLVESGEPASAEAALRLAGALGLRLELALSDPRRRTAARPMGADSLLGAPAAREPPIGEATRRSGAQRLQLTWNCAGR